MAIDITVFPFLDPRVVVVDAPQTSASVQEIVDAIRAWEDNEENMSYERLIDAAGKEDLGGGVSVGITATLQNAQLRFAARPTPLSSGTATSSDTGGTTLTDTGADFLAEGVYAGCTVQNDTTNSLETVISVTTNSVTTFPLLSGSRQDWQIGDSYLVYPNEVCNISGGNLVAIDAVGANLEPVFQAPNINVVRASSSSATIQSQQQLEHASFNGGVTLDLINGVSGTAYPVGTESAPVNNLEDALTIMGQRGFSKLFIIGNYNFDSSDNIDGVIVIGQNPRKTVLTLPSGLSTEGAEFNQCSISGTLDGNTWITDSNVANLNYIQGRISNCVLIGTTILSGTEDVRILNCTDGTPGGDNIPVIDMGGGGRGLVISNYSGELFLKNLTGGDAVDIGLNTGQISLDSTVTDGDIVVRGIGTLEDNSGVGALVNSDALINKNLISEAVLNTELVDFVAENTVASSLQLSSYQNRVTVDTATGSSGTSYPFGTPSSPVDNLDDAVTIAESLGFDTIEFKTDYTFTNTTSIADYTLRGQGMSSTLFTFETGSIVANCRVESTECTGFLTGMTGFEGCLINSLGSIGLVPSSQNIVVKDCLLGGLISIPSNYSGTLKALNCWSDVPGTNTPILDMGDSTADIIIRNYSGGMELHNITENINATIELSAGQVIVDSSCSDGYLSIRGVGLLSDNSTGTMVVETDALMNKDVISEAVWDETLANHTIADSTGEALLGITYDNRIFIDTVNGSAGTVHPIGTKKAPVDNFADALTLSSEYSINRFHIIGSLSISGGEDISGYTFGADRSTGNVLIASNVITDFTYIEDLTVIMAQSGSARYTTSVLVDIDDFDGGAKDCLLVGDINIVGSGSNYFTNCDTYVTDDSVPVSLSVNDKKLNLIRGRGNYKITDKTGGPATSIDLVAGYIEIDSTCTAGSIYVSGVCDVIDNSGPGCTVVVRAIGNDSVSDAVWDEQRSGHTNAGSFGATDEWASSIDLDSIADAVWEEPADEHEDANTMGEKQNAAGEDTGLADGSPFHPQGTLP